jgi:hypothetical protein
MAPEKDQRYGNNSVDASERAKSVIRSQDPTLVWQSMGKVQRLNGSGSHMKV